MSTPGTGAGRTVTYLVGGELYALLVDPPVARLLVIDSDGVRLLARSEDTRGMISQFREAVAGRVLENDVCLGAFTVGGVDLVVAEDPVRGGAHVAEANPGQPDSTRYFTSVDQAVRFWRLRCARILVQHAGQD